MTTTRIATSLQKIVVMGIPPGLLLNLRLQRYIASDTDASKTIKSAKPPCRPHRFARFTMRSRHRAFSAT
jgi:hypothetical protein